MKHWVSPFNSNSSQSLELHDLIEAFFFTAGLSMVFAAFFASILTFPSELSQAGLSLCLCLLLPAVLPLSMLLSRAFKQLLQIKEYSSKLKRYYILCLFIILPILCVLLAQSSGNDEAYLLWIIPSLIFLIALWSSLRSVRKTPSPIMSPVLLATSFFMFFCMVLLVSYQVLFVSALLILSCIFFICSLSYVLSRNKGTDFDDNNKQKSNIEATLVANDKLMLAARITKGMALGVALGCMMTASPSVSEVLKGCSVTLLLILGGIVVMLSDNNPSHAPKEGRIIPGIDEGYALLMLNVPLLALFPYLAGTGLFIYALVFSFAIIVSDTNTMRHRHTLLKASSCVGVFFGMSCAYIVFSYFNDLYFKVALSFILILIFFLAISIDFSEAVRIKRLKTLNIDMAGNEGKTSWNVKVTVVANRYGLTPRQAEILEALSRGRSAKFIEKKLVIAESTAKSHIHAIYKKTGMHCQDDLIDLVKNVKL